jgi:NADPH:quinone reductase-like Zn-dependent oxidoreductase
MTSSTKTMTAVTRRTYGGPEVLAIEQVPVPVPGKGELLLRVEHASVNPADRYFMCGTPTLVRTQTGFGQPKAVTFGIDVAGTVEAIGPEVTGFAVGDRIVAGSGTGYAELAIVRVGRACHLPDDVSTRDAAMLPVAGATAIQGLDKGQVGEGTRLLVNGASGGVGHLAVQLAVARGAKVTGVCSTRNLDFVRSLGATDVIDYTTTDFTTLGRTWDVLFDNQGNHSPAASRSVLADDGRWVIVNGPMTSKVWGPMRYVIGALGSSLFASQKAIQFTASEDTATLARLVYAVADGSLTPHVEQSFPLAELPAAMTHLGTHRTVGKLHIAVS